MRNPFVRIVSGLFVNAGYLNVRHIGYPSLKAISVTPERQGCQERQENIPLRQTVKWARLLSKSDLE